MRKVTKLPVMYCRSSLIHVNQLSNVHILTSLQALKQQVLLPSCVRFAAKHTWLHCQLPDLNDRADLALWRCMQHDGDRARDAQQAAKTAKQVEPLIEHEVGKDVAAQDRRGGMQGQKADGQLH